MPAGAKLTDWGDLFKNSTKVRKESELRVSELPGTKVANKESDVAAHPNGVALTSEPSDYTDTQHEFTPRNQPKLRGCEAADYNEATRPTAIGR
jgi:hypothetical protein